MTLQTHRATLGSLALAALLAGCGSSVSLKEPAPVETRSAAPRAPGAGTAATAPQAPAAGTAVARPQSAVTTFNLGSAQAAAAPAERTVYFDFDSFVVKDTYRPMVEGHARALAADRFRRLVVEGHTDDRGSREYNLALGQKRAEAVVRSLELLGAQKSQLEAVSFGEERPAVQGGDESAWAKNRRAELKDR